MVEGEYHRAFAIMKLNEDYSNPENVTLEKDSAYLHEYIHFIQDFGTCYGIDQSVDRLSRYLDMIIQIQTDNYSGYLKLNDEADFVSSLFVAAAGDSIEDISDTVCHKVNGIEILEDKEYYEEDYPQYMDLFKPSVIVQYNDEKEYQFGGEAVAENMAYLFEKLFFNANDYEKSLPYNSCEIVYKEIIGTSCDSIQIMIALCYASLMSHFPGYTFYMLVKRIKDLKSIPKKMEDIFEIARNLMQEVNENQIKNLEERIDYALPIIENEVTVEKLYSPFICNLKYCNNWLKSTYRHMIENEEKFRNTLIYILEDEDILLRKARMRELIKINENPLLIDKTGKLYSKDDKHLIFLLAPYALQQTIMNKQTSCALLPICTAYKKEISKKCGEFWWKKEFSNKICIMRFYLYLMNLGDVQFDELDNYLS